MEIKWFSLLIRVTINLSKIFRISGSHKKDIRIRFIKDRTRFILNLCNTEVYLKSKEMFINLKLPSFKAKILSRFKDHTCLVFPSQARTWSLRINHLWINKRTRMECNIFCLSSSQMRSTIILKTIVSNQYFQTLRILSPLLTYKENI